MSARGGTRAWTHRCSRVMLMVMCLDSRRTRSGSGCPRRLTRPAFKKALWRLLSPEDKRSALTFRGCPETVKTAVRETPVTIDILKNIHVF